MYVQERPKPHEDRDRKMAADGEEDDDDENELAGLLSSPKKDAGLRFRDKLTDHFPKVAVIGLLCLSAFILIVVKDRSQTGAVLCIESEITKEAESIPYPSVNFRNVKKIVDTSVFAGVHAENWIVVAVSGPPTEEIYALSKLQGWRTVAVGGFETPSDWNVSGVIYLSPQQQAALPYRIIPYLPRTAYVRKSVGYLFAIQHGAKKIYDADENASVLGGELDKAFDIDLHGGNSRRDPLLQYLSLPNRTCVNPYIHFGQQSVWPRGLPLSLVGRIESEVAYGQVFSGKQFIQQGISVGFPDVDSIFYHTRKSMIKPFVINFDSNAPPVALPQGVMAPVNSLNTLFHSASFWGLMLPISVSTKASDILRGYWAQRLLWEIGGYLTIHPPSAYRIDRMSPPAYADEKDLHNNVDRLTKFLISWRSKKLSLFQKALHLSHSMAEEGFWTAQDVIYTAAWLQDLLSLSYVQPRVLALELDRGVSLTQTEEHKMFTPRKLPSVHLGVEEAYEVSPELGNLIKLRKYYGNIVLILECSWPFNHTVLAWKMLYGRMFKSVIVLSAHSDTGFGVGVVDSKQSYRALPPIFEKFPNAEGFLFLKDDVILNYWKLVGADKSKLWNFYRNSIFWRQVNLFKEGPAWFQKENIRKSVQTMLNMLSTNYRSIYRSNIDQNRYAVCRSNVFYIPHRYVSDFADLTSIAVTANLRHEVAVPLFFLAMASKQEFDQFAFTDIIFKPGEGSNAAEFYSMRPHIVYPWPAKNEHEIQRIIKAMGAGDPLLLKFVP